jgi:hypothetical protein
MEFDDHTKVFNLTESCVNVLRILEQFIRYAMASVIVVVIRCNLFRAPVVTLENILKYLNWRLREEI